MIKFLIVAVFLLLSPKAFTQTENADSALLHSIKELRTSEGQWSVQTDFLNEDGSVAKSVIGTYTFTWVVPDKVLVGHNEIPDLNQASGILFYIDEKNQQIEMAAVGGDGKLWIMNGALGEDIRYTQEYPTADGGTGQLRFTRFNVGEDAFESKMEYTDDGGQTWKAGNHQWFRRVGKGEE